MTEFHDYAGYTSVEYLLHTLADSPIKQRSYALMQVAPGHNVLDVGCGPGIDTVALAERVRPTGRVAGVDHDPAMIAAADAHAQRAGVAGYVAHHRGDVSALPFPSATFDACRCERVFQHLDDPHPALAEIVRVIRPGGRIVLIDADWGTFSIDTPAVELERRVRSFVLDQVLRNGYAGRQLYRLARQHGLSDITVEAYTRPITSYHMARVSLQLDVVERAALAAGVITPDELEHWSTWMQQAAREETFYCSVSQIVVAGRRP